MRYSLWSGETEEDYEGAGKGEHVGVGNGADVLAQFGPRHGGYLIDHDAAELA
jgi:hypothetical protein